MNLVDSLNLIFNKNKVVRVNIYESDRRFKTYIRRVHGNMITIDEKDYVVVPELCFYQKGVPTLSYMFNNPEPFNMMSGNIEGLISPEEINSTINNTVYKNMVSDLLKGEKKVINAILVASGIVILVVIGTAYMIYDSVLKLSVIIAENQDAIEALIRGAIN